VSAYYEHVMNRVLLPSGRVRYFPMSDYQGDGRIVSLVSGAETRVEIARKTVDSTYLATSVPATHTRKFSVAEGVRIMPPNDLPHLWRDPAAMPRHFTVLGAGKTGIDTIIFLLKAGATPDMISWVAPRASWFYNRKSIQPGTIFFERTLGAALKMRQAIAEASDVNDMFLRMEASGWMHRISRDELPTMFHYAVCSEAEIAQLQRIGDVIRQGRVLALEPDRMVLEQGTRATAPGTLFIDCTATAVERRPPVPVFQPGLIVPQMVRMPQPAFSAALIAWVEAHVDGEAAQNALTRAVPLPDTIQEFARAELVNIGNEGKWSANPAMRAWIDNCRLDSMGKEIRRVTPADTDKMAILMQIGPATMAAAANLQRLMA
jgi:hypothetical protein